MKNLFFDAGNTLILFDYDLISKSISDAGFAVTPDQVMRAEYATRFEIDHLVAPYVIDRHAPVPAMQSILPYGNFHGSILTHLGVPGRLTDRISESLAGLYGRLWRAVAPGTEEALDGLKQKGFRLNVISNSDGSVERILTEVGLRRFFDRVFDSHLVGLEKPNPEFFKHALKETACEAAESAYFGDFYSIDYLGSRRAGMTGVLFDRGDLYRHVQCARITHLSQIEGWLDGHL